MTHTVYRAYNNAYLNCQSMCTVVSIQEALAYPRLIMGGTGRGGAENAVPESAGLENAGLENIGHGIKYKFQIDARVTDTSSRPQYT